MKIVLDTNAYSGLMRGDNRIVSFVRIAEILIVPATVVGELLYGFRLGSRPRENKKQLGKFLASPYVNFKPVDLPVCDRYALIMQQLSGKRRPIPSNDVWIAAHTLAEGADLLTLDDHYLAIDGLSLCEV